MKLKNFTNTLKWRNLWARVYKQPNSDQKTINVALTNAVDILEAQVIILQEQINAFEPSNNTIINASNIGTGTIDASSCSWTKADMSCIGGSVMSEFAKMDQENQED